MAGEVVVDALPYIDQGYDDPGVREAVRIEPNLLSNFHEFLLFNHQACKSMIIFRRQHYY